MRPRCRVCRSRRCLTPIERERARRVQEELRVAALRDVLLELSAAGLSRAPVLAAAERWERAWAAWEAAASEDRPSADFERLGAECRAAEVALLAAVRARRVG